MRCYVFGLVELADFIFEKEDEHGQKHEGQLTFADFMSVVLDLRKALQKLNVPLTKPCCRFHSGVEELRKSLRELSCHACAADPSFHPNSQCPQCGILSLGDSDVLHPMECEVCQFQGAQMIT